jgi:hypothetical protein
MENPLLERIINGPPRAAENAIRALKGKIRSLKGPIILGAVGLLLCLTWHGTLYFHYSRVSGSYPPPNLLDIGGELVLSGLMPQVVPQVDPQVAHLLAGMTPEQIYLSRNYFIGMAIGSLLIFLGPIWAYCRLFIAAKKKTNAEKWRPRDGNW